MRPTPARPDPLTFDARQDPEALYLSHRHLLDEIIGRVARRRGFTVEDAEEFAASVRLRLVESDYAILRKFQGRSSLKTYLTVVIERLALDYRTAQWGKWRPSAIARAGGPAAVRLEQLVVRDGVPLESALQSLPRTYGPSTDLLALQQLATRFPLRSRRCYVGEEVLEAVAADSTPTEELLIRAEAADRFERVTARLHALVSALATPDRLVLQMRFEQGLTMAQIARALDLDQKRLYRTFEHVLASLRATLEAEGISVADIRGILDHDAGAADGGNLRPVVRLHGGERP